MTRTERQILAEFKQWRAAEGLGFTEAYVPAKFGDLKTLDVEYADAEFEAAKTSKTARAAPRPQNGYVTEETLIDVLHMFSSEFVEPRLAALESEWGGVWEAGKSYRKGSVVAHSGSGWIATRAYPERTPGSENSGWKLFAKRGRFSK